MAEWHCSASSFSFSVKRLFDDAKGELDGAGRKFTQPGMGLSKVGYLILATLFSTSFAISYYEHVNMAILAKIHDISVSEKGVIPQNTRKIAVSMVEREEFLIFPIFLCLKMGIIISNHI